jgi:hypothetical protein
MNSKYPESEIQKVISALQSLVSTFEHQSEIDEMFHGPIIHARIALQDIKKWEFVSIEEIDSKI